MKGADIAHCRILSSGAAGTLMMGVKLAMEGPPGRVDPSKKTKASRFYPLYFRGAPLGSMMGPFESGIGPDSKLKLTLADPMRALQSM